MLFYIASIFFGFSYIIIMIYRVKNDKFLRSKSKLIEGKLDNSKAIPNFISNDHRLVKYKRYTNLTNIFAMVAILLIIPMSFFALRGYYLFSYISFILAIIGFLISYKKFIYTYSLIKENYIVTKVKKQNVLIEINESEKGYIRKVYLKYINGILFGILFLIIAFTYIFSV
ncbi:hypothetical protein GCM10019994_35670 [Enterococcus raffinosus]|mgnify:CR=1 FL=1